MLLKAWHPAEQRHPHSPRIDSSRRGWKQPSPGPREWLPSGLSGRMELAVSSSCRCGDLNLPGVLSLVCLSGCSPCVFPPRCLQVQPPETGCVSSVADARLQQPDSQHRASEYGLWDKRDTDLQPKLPAKAMVLEFHWSSLRKG